MYNAVGLAADLIGRYGSLSGVMEAARTSNLATHNPRVRNRLLSVANAIGHLAMALEPASMVAVGSPLLARQLQAAMAHEERERLRILHLDGQQRLILDEYATTGTATYIECPNGEIFLRALQLGTKQMVIAHNHPSGCPEPSRADSDYTRALCGLAAGLGIRLLDHIVVATRGTYSFRAAGIL